MSRIRHPRDRQRIAYFITSHGFGHATRAAAVMAAIAEAEPGVEFDVFTGVPRWVFEDSLRVPFRYHLADTDVGLIQTTPLTEDLPATLRALDHTLPFDQAAIDVLTAQLAARGVDLVVTDIAPAAIAAARQIRVPSVLVENFTWDWIYRSYVTEYPEFERHAEYLGGLFDAADHRIQVDPVCDPRPSALRTEPISRDSRTPSAETRRRLGVSPDARVLLLTMGGTLDRLPIPQNAEACGEVHFVIPGASDTVERRENLVLLPHRSEFHHPDLVDACDAVVGKVGASTVGEAYCAGVPFGYIPRPTFPESPVLVSYIEQHMEGVAIRPSEWAEGTWVTKLPELLERPRREHRRAGGAHRAAEFILSLLD